MGQSMVFSPGWISRKTYVQTPKLTRFGVLHNWGRGPALKILLKYPVRICDVFFASKSTPSAFTWLCAFEPADAYFGILLVGTLLSTPQAIDSTAQTSKWFMKKRRTQHSGSWVLLYWMQKRVWLWCRRLPVMSCCRRIQHRILLGNLLMLRFGVWSSEVRKIDDTNQILKKWSL